MMRAKMIPVVTAVLWATLTAGQAPAADEAQGVRVVSAIRLSSGADDNLEDVAIAPDGTIYVAGNFGRTLETTPRGRAAPALGGGDPGWQYGTGFVAAFCPEGRNLRAIWQLGQGVARVTTVAVGPGGVYVGGYTGPGIEPILSDLGGVMTTGSYPQRDYRLYTPREHFTEDRLQPANDQRGLPFVLRLDPQLGVVHGGTLLEGWQSTWHVPRPLGPRGEDRWQPVGLAILPDGDLVVSHDGGYCRPPADGVNATWDDFHDVPDYVSRLSTDLTQRRWRREIHRPQMDRDNLLHWMRRRGRLWRAEPDFQWEHTHLGQPRILRLRPDGRGGVLLAGWSASRTSDEPWWTPFLLGLNGQGQTVLEAYAPDPMSGGGGRLGGLVSDAAIRSVAVDADGNLLVAGIGDGGNSVLRHDPRDYNRPAANLRGGVHSFAGRTLFWGTAVRLDGRTGELLGGQHISGWGNQRLAAAWAEDLAPLPDGRVLVVGRQTGGFQTTPDAWHASQTATVGAGRNRGQGPQGGFVRLYGPDFAMVFSSAIPDVAAVTVDGRGSRFVLVGEARGEGAPVTSADWPARGGVDGYLMVVDVPEAGE